MTRLEGEEFDKVKATIAARIRELRLAKGLSQEELADEAGVHRTYVGMLERRQGNPSLRVLVAIANALGVETVGFLLTTSLTELSKGTD